MKGLTKRQSEILQYIDSFIQSHRHSPSYREIQRHFGFSSLGTVHGHVQVLKRKGILQAEERAGRSIAPKHEVKPEVTLPLIGQLSHGNPIETFMQAMSHEVPASFVRAQGKSYVLRIIGDGFASEMITDGDLLIVEARQEAHPGETVLAKIHDHETVIRKYFYEGSYLYLASISPHLHPMILRPEDVHIHGILTGLIRNYG